MFVCVRNILFFSFLITSVVALPMSEVFAANNSATSTDNTSTSIPADSGAKTDTDTDGQ